MYVSAYVGDILQAEQCSYINPYPANVDNMASSYQC